jgi:hypothetical protein
MGDVLFLPNARISAQQITALSNTASARSIFTGAVTTLDRTGDRLRWGVSTQNAANTSTYAERSALQAFRARLRGMSNRVLFIDPAYRFRGSFPTSELLSNGKFANGSTGWSTSSANIVINALDGVLRSTRASVSADETIRAAVATTVSGASYILRVMAYAGRGPMDFRLRAGTTAGGNELAASPADITTAGMKTLSFAATGTSTHISIVDGTSSRSIGHYMDFAYVSLSRCALISGVSQTGSSLLIDALPTSTAGLARVGDRVQIGNDLNTVIATLDSDSSGAGYLQLAYPPRTTPADNAPVIFHEPMARCVLTSNEGGWSDSPGNFSDFDFEIEEALDS